MSGNFVDGQGNLERTWKVREKSGNLKINDYMYSRQTSEFCLFCSRGEKTYFLMKLSPSHPLLGATFKGKNLGSKYFPLKVTPKFEMMQLAH